MTAVFIYGTFMPGEVRWPGIRVVLRGDTEDDALRRLDEIEGEGVLYRRVAIETSEGSALSYEWMGSTDGMRPLPRGWRPFG